MTAGLVRTPLYDEHVRLGGKIVPFAGFEMPVQYPSGIRKEHETVRQSVGVFDVSHMGEFIVRGPQALDLVQRITVNDASKIEVGQAQYSAMCRESGVVIDDLLVYRYPDHFMLVVNASNRMKDLEWTQTHASDFEADIDDASDRVALIAVQGPHAAAVLSALTDTDLGTIGYYRFAEGIVAGASGTISRTGYTGEDGFELYLDAEDAEHVWREVLSAGEGVAVRPAGLGCRDSLRLEMGYALYGNDLDEEHTALESALGWIVKLEKGDFVGRDALASQKEAGPTRRLAGFRLSDRGFPRAGYEIVVDGAPAGQVTSGTLSPSLGVGVGLGYVPVSHAKSGSEIAVRIRDRDLSAVVERPPFYKEGSIQR